LDDSRPPHEFFYESWVRPQARPGRTLIVGSRIYSDKPDRRAMFKDAVGVDQLAGDGVDIVCDVEGDVGALGTFDHVECLSVLEHSRRPWLLAANIERLMRKHATLFLSVPFVWRVHDYPGDYWRFTGQGVRELFPDISWHQMRYASHRLKPDHYLNAQEIDGHPYLPRTEVLGFGHRK
jgi:hypothetical protein